MLLLIILNILLCSNFSVAQLVECYTTFLEDKGECKDILGYDIQQTDCCLNPKYGFRGQDGKCNSCRKAQWGPWSPWGACSVSCREGVKIRWRACYGIGRCKDASQTLQTMSCRDQECCPVNGGWSTWGPWQPCSVTCKSGVRKRERSCTNPSPSCGGQCIGSNNETEICDTLLICPTHGSWASWEVWGPCSGICKVEGSQNIPFQQRTRRCSDPPPSVNPRGNDCPGTPIETQECNHLPLCPVHGSWSEWVTVSECPVTCGLGLQLQKRECNNPAPKHNGQQCPGENSRKAVCNTNVHCPVDGRWTEWEEWSDCKRHGRRNISCSATAGMQSRTRSCVGREFEGDFCDGDSSDNRGCYNIEGCSMEGKWSEWSNWGFCEPPCGAESRKTRSRHCTPIYPAYPEYVGQYKNLKAFFWGESDQSCPPIPPYNSNDVITEMAQCQEVPICESVMRLRNRT
ncbi:properdin-like isoform X1 [Erpetoichthys calabaricus]|uniref:properdin-like isoform X1 n=1 Tax=Erpetoichthys calabaricus TaxID=27687 RepID=UPI002234C83D|nr:properdin-like isoform X1 [Erpetoichthys calabaricus]